MKQGRIFTKKTIVDGITFDSEMESKRYIELKKMQEEGIITDLVLQPIFPLTPEMEKVDPFNGKTKKFGSMDYVADFMYKKDGLEIIEDVKGFILNEFVVKQKLFEFMYPDKTITLIVQGPKDVGFLELNDNELRKKQKKNAKRDLERARKEKLKNDEKLKEKRNKLISRLNELLELSNPTSVQRKRIVEIRDFLIPEIEKELLG